MSGGLRRIGLAGAAGLIAGIALAGIEITTLDGSAGPMPATLIFDAAVIDGGIGLAAGLVGGAIWAMLSWVIRLWRPSDPVKHPVPTGISRRGFVRLAGTGVVLAGAGAAALYEWNAPQRRADFAASSGTTSQPAVPPFAGNTPPSASRPPAATAASTAPLPAQSSRRPPNILLVTLDTTRADQLGCYGHPFMKTPALDAMAAQGARFAWHMVQQPQTNPSHASMFTGLYPASSGIRVHMVDKIPNQLETLPKLLSSAGYSTAGLFSWLSFDNQYCNFQPGFQVYEDLTDAASSLLNKPGIRDVAAQYRTAEQYLSIPKLVSQAVGVQQQQETSGKGHADVTTSAAIDQLGSFGNQPFFMWLHYFDPHYPYQAPDSFINMYDSGYSGPVDNSMNTVDAIQDGKLELKPPDVKRLMAYYQAELSFMDSQLNGLFRALDARNLTENTVVAVVGDHGESFGEHTALDENGDFFHPHSVYNSELRVPMLLRYPKAIKAGTAISAPTQSIDLFPTLLELAGVPPSAQAQGQSLVPLLDGRDGGHSRASFSAMPDYVFTSVAVPGWKLIRNVASGENRLFDLTKDPNEQTDLFPSNAAVGSPLAKQLEAWMKRVSIQ